MKLILIIMAVVGAVYSYGVYQDNPADIASPVYVESRVVLTIPKMARELEYVVVGEMTSMEDCQQRSKRYLENLFEKCDTCSLKQHQCKSDLAHRYKKLFVGQTTHTTYLSLNKGNRFERNARMVIWGLTEEEADMACEHIQQKVKETYNGTTRCVAGRAS